MKLPKGLGDSRDRFLKRYAQIIYAIILSLLIPGIILFNTWSVIKIYRTNNDLLLQRQALLLADIIDAVGIDTVNDTASVQRLLDAVTKATSDLRSIDVLVKSDDGFRIVASQIPNQVGIEDPNINNALAWQKDRGIAHLATATTNKPEEGLKVGATYWNLVFPIHATDGARIGLIHMHMPLTVAEQLNTAALTRSFMLLIVSIIAVLLLLLINTRLFQYAIYYRKLQEVDQMKDEFISMASHELRTPITAIKGYVSMFLDGSFGVLSDTATKSMKVIGMSIERLANLVEDLLNVSRIEQGRLQVAPIELQLNEVIQQTLDELAPSAKEKALDLVFNPLQMPVSVLADRDRLRQILVNLIGNAIKYTKKGSVTVTTLEDETSARVKIKDTGIGIAAKDRDKLFSKFYRVQNENTKGIVGTGLGLWITKQIIELMGGTVAVDSIEGVGTEISFTLPKATKKR